MSEADQCELKPAAPAGAETTLECAVRKRTVRVSRYYHFFSRGCCSTYSYLYAALCDCEDACRREGVYDQCPLLKELLDQND